MPWEEFSFLFNSGGSLKSDYLEIGTCRWQSRAPVHGPVRFGRSMKIQGRELFSFLVVLITASGLQGEQPLVGRRM